jgi:hypothetical protein
VEEVPDLSNAEPATSNDERIHTGKIEMPSMIDQWPSDCFAGGANAQLAQPSIILKCEAIMLRGSYLIDPVLIHITSCRTFETR